MTSLQVGINSSVSCGTCKHTNFIREEIDEMVKRGKIIARDPYCDCQETYLFCCYCAKKLPLDRSLQSQFEVWYANRMNETLDFGNSMIWIGRSKCLKHVF